MIIWLMIGTSFMHSIGVWLIYKVLFGLVTRGDNGRWKIKHKYLSGGCLKLLLLILLPNGKFMRCM
jgi:hypothetical protein